MANPVAFSTYNYLGLAILVILIKRSATDVAPDTRPISCFIGTAVAAKHRNAV